MTAVIQDFIPKGRKNRPAKLNPMLYITIHNTGNTNKGAGAKNHASYLKSDAAADIPVSWHYTVDEKSIYQHLPDNETAYHAGDGGAGTGNAKSIGIEICMNSDGNLLAATDNAAELTAKLCETYDISLKNVVQHNNWTGKDCPQLLRAGKPYSWDAFITKVKELLAPEPVPEPTPAPEPVPQTADTPSDWAAPSCKKAVDCGLILGDGNGYYGWHEPVPMERLITLLDKLGLIE